MRGRKSLDQHLKAVQKAVAEKRFDDALESSALGFKRSIADKADARAQTFLRMMRSIVTVLDKDGTPERADTHSCSFCGRTPPVQMLVGANGAICKDCARRASTFFSSS